MPALTALTITDRASTPVDHTYTPNGGEGPKFQSFVSTNGVVVGDKRLTVTVKQNADTRKATLVFADPVVATETINGVDRPTVVRTAYAKVEFQFHKESNLQERKDIVGKVHDVLAEDQTFVMKVLQDLEGMY